MSTDEQAGTTSGSVPQAYRNAIFWRWAPEMPRALSGAFLTLLYALGTASDASGRLRFARDGKAIRVTDIARAARASEKDARRYLDAAIAAGVVGVQGDRRRGKATMYVLLVCAYPDWAAAERSLKDSRRPPGKTPPPWSKASPAAESSDPRDPNQFGPPRPELSGDDTEEVRVTATRMGSDPRDPNGSGHRDPNNPGSTHVLPQEMAEVVPQPQVDPAEQPKTIFPITQQSPTNDTAPSAGFTRCTVCGDQMLPRPGRETTHAHCTASAPRPHPKGSAA